MTHPYFATKARTAFAAAGGDPDKAGPLSAWAESARHRQPQPHGVLVAADGKLLAETTHVEGRGATYIHAALTPEARELEEWEVGLAVHRCPKLIGQGAAEIRVSQLCYGTGSPTRDEQQHEL